jgi:hypothetical protein
MAVNWASAGAAPLPSSRSSHAARVRATGSADVRPATAVVMFCLPTVASKVDLSTVALAKVDAASSDTKIHPFISTPPA